MTNKEKAYLTWLELQKRKAKRKKLEEKEHNGYVCDMIEKKKRNCSIRYGGYRK